MQLCEKAALMLAMSQAAEADEDEEEPRCGDSCDEATAVPDDDCGSSGHCGICNGRRRSAEPLQYQAECRL